MKKIAILAAILSLSCGAFAQSAATATQQQGQQQQSLSQASTDGNQQNITVTVGSTSGTGTGTDGTTRAVTASTSANTEHIAYDNAQVIKNTPSVSGPNLTTSNDTCMGSASGSVNAPGVGLSLGKTYVDDNCVRLKNSRELWNMGMKGAALALMCGDTQNRQALELTGYVCPQSMSDDERTKAYHIAPRISAVERQQTIATASAIGEPTDKFVRMRKGLPPLADN